MITYIAQRRHHVCKDSPRKARKNKSPSLPLPKWTGLKKDDVYTELILLLISNGLHVQKNSISSITNTKRLLDPIWITRKDFLTNPVFSTRHGCRKAILRRFCLSSIDLQNTVDDIWMWWISSFRWHSLRTRCQNSGPYFIRYHHHCKNIFKTDAEFRSN